MGKKYIEDRIDIKSTMLLLKDISPIENEETSLLFDRLTYAIFGISIMPQNEMSIAGLERLSALYLQVMNLSGDWSFNLDVKNVINDMYEMVKKALPLKVGIKNAAKLLREQLVNNPFRDGIELGLVSGIMDLSKTPYLREELPYYSRLGLGYHSNRCVNEEEQLLSDAFYLLVLAKDQYEKMFIYKKNLPKNKTEKHLNEITNLNANVCSLCRNCIVNFYAFFEGYINGLGLNYLFSKKDTLSLEDIYALQGKDRVGNHYLKMEIKIECLQKIIGHKVLYPTNNPQQLKDNSFIALLEKMREKRDVAMHYSKAKGEIMFSPQEWMDEAIMISQHIVDASKKLWKACYPLDNHYPYYLRELAYDYLIDEAQKRILVISPQ